MTETDYDAQRRSTLCVGTAAELSEGHQVVEDAPVEDLYEALDARARAGNRTAWKIIRSELRRRAGEGGCMPELPRTIEEHGAQFERRAADIEAEHQRYERGSVVTKHLMRKAGYRPREAATTPPPSDMATPTTALTLISSSELKVGSADLAKLQAAAIDQIAAVGRFEANAAMGAVLAGLSFHRVKASMPHGAFGAWIEKASAKGSIKRRQVNYVMRLSLEFIERTKVQKPDLVALPGDQTLLQLGDNHEAKKFVKKLTGFVGDLSLTELLIKYGIKGVGLKSGLEAGAPDELTPDQKTQQAREQAWNAAWESTQVIRNSLTDPEAIQFLADPEKLQQLKAELAEIARLADERLAALRAVTV